MSRPILSVIKRDQVRERPSPPTGRPRQGEKADRAEKELAREARKTERDQARQAHGTRPGRAESAAPRTRLTDLLAKRELPKSGDIDQLIERLIKANSK